MTETKKPTSREELERIEDAWIESILDASGDDLRIAITEAGDDPNAYIEIADTTLESALAHCGQERLQRAKAEAAAFRAQEAKKVIPFDREKARVETSAMELELSSTMMLAARKGRHLSGRDDEALLRAKAKLKRLESEDNSE